MYSYVNELWVSKQHQETYTPIDSRTIMYPHKYAVWPEYITGLGPHIEYLEIGSLHGASVLAFHRMFGTNVHSTSIDPFATCDYYPEYNNEHEQNYEIYKNNTAQLGTKNTHIRKPSYDIVPTLPNNYYDVVYIDGNHNLSNLLEDVVLCYRKLKTNGYMIIDDVNWGYGQENTASTVSAFIHAYTLQKMQLVHFSNEQAILKKIQ